jgi:hypothetical protein
VPGADIGEIMIPGESPSLAQPPTEAAAELRPDA